jgi:hypothetical protein
MASRKRLTAPEERQERVKRQERRADAREPVATRERRAPSADALEQASSPRMTSVSVLPVGGEAARNDATQRPAADVAHTPSTSSPRNSDVRQSVRQNFGELRTALSEGWEIVQPIYARPLWSTADNSTTAFNFVLRREQATRLVTVPDGRTVQRFIRNHELTVDYRR